MVVGEHHDDDGAGPFALVAPGLSISSGNTSATELRDWRTATQMLSSHR
jgi:hypothetical protein